MDRRCFLELVSLAGAERAIAKTPGLAAQTPATPALNPSYIEVSRQAGLDFTNVFGGAKSKRYLIETTGCGVAWIDYNRDGHPDLFLVNGTTIEGFPPGKEPTNRLFKNNGDGTFTDVTVKAGLVHSGWGQGVCVGDYDNDGWDDLFVTYYGKNLLYHNNGDGTFTEVAGAAGVAGDPWRWNTGCAFVDYDRDGFLDLFVANYVDQGKDFRLLPQPGSGQFCQYKGIPMACGPRGLKSGRNFLYRNNGDGTFSDVSEKAGILLPDKHYALGVLTLDYDNDGWEDIYVACDSTASILYHNNRNGTFTDLAFATGIAYNGDGEAQAGMGVSACDYDGDGFLDIAKTNFSDDTPDLYHNNRDGTFSDVTFAAGLGAHPNYMGWGVGFIDFDNDGWPDLFIANGHLSSEIDQYHIDSTYAEPKLLYRNVPGPRGERRFEDISRFSGPGIQLMSSSRGVAFADYDNDGAIDIVISNMNGPAYLLRNKGSNRNHWIKIKTNGVKSNRNGIGTRVEVRTGAKRQIDEVRSGGSYLSQNDLRLHFGLGDHTVADEIILRWPSGQVDHVRRIHADRTITLQEGKGLIET
ncbi:MAG TPA: CRTAC1 family protein [Terriglobia bacterium]|nr:CRTAC1 family protein [Terriglobia bacterium]